MTYIPYLGTFFFSRYPSVALACNINMKNFEKGFSFHETHARSPRGGLTMGRTAERRSELVELADDSVSSTDATIPSSPRGARPMTGSIEALLYVSQVER